MKVVLRNDEYTIYQRRDGRYAVEGADKKAINGDEKIAILVANDLIKAALPAAPEPEPAEETAEEATAEEAPAEAAASEEAEAPAEDAGDTES